MKLNVYSIFLRLVIGNPLIDNSTENYPTATTVENYSIATPTDATSSIYTQVSSPAFTGLPHSKNTHHHKHRHGSAKYPKASPTNIVSYPIETSSVASDQSGAESNGASSYVPPLGSNKLNVALDSNADNSTNDVTTDNTTATTVAGNQAISSPTPLPDFYNQIQASSFGDV